jgi:hypothetical protein
LYAHIGRVKEGEIYSIEYAGRIEVKQFKNDKDALVASGYSHPPQKLVRLIPESKEESQERIIKDLLADYRALEKTGATHYSIELTLLDKFTITRKS